MRRKGRAAQVWARVVTDVTVRVWRVMGMGRAITAQRSADGLRGRTGGGCGPVPRLGATVWHQAQNSYAADAVPLMLTGWAAISACQNPAPLPLLLQPDSGCSQGVAASAGTDPTADADQPQQHTPGAPAPACLFPCWPRSLAACDEAAGLREALMSPAAAAVTTALCCRNRAAVQPGAVRRTPRTRRQRRNDSATRAVRRGPNLCVGSQLHCMSTAYRCMMRCLRRPPFCLLPADCAGGPPQLLPNQERSAAGATPSPTAVLLAARPHAWARAPLLRWPLAGFGLVVQQLCHTHERSETHVRCAAPANVVFSSTGSTLSRVPPGIKHPVQAQCSSRFPLLCKGRPRPNEPRMPPNAPP